MRYVRKHRILTDENYSPALPSDKGSVEVKALDWPNWWLQTRYSEFFWHV